MLQIRKINSRSNRACRSLFQLFQPLSYETLDFHFVKTAQHTLLSKPRAVTPRLSIHKNYETQLSAIPRREYTFLLYCRSRPRLQNTKIAFSPSAPFIFFVLGALGAHHIFEVCNPSRARMRFLRMFVVNVLLGLRFFTSGIDLQLVEYALAISNGKPRMILTVFTCTRFCNAMLLPPKRQQPFFFNHDALGKPKRRFPR